MLPRNGNRPDISSKWTDPLEKLSACHTPNMNDVADNDRPWNAMNMRLTIDQAKEQVGATARYAISSTRPGIVA